jgi:hypothetical protein
MLKDVIFSRFGVSRYLIIDGGSHFLHGVLIKTSSKYGFDHRVGSPYHRQTSSQVELSNRKLKFI